MRARVLAICALAATVPGLACSANAPAPAWHRVAEVGAGRTAGPLLLAGRWLFVANRGDGTVTQVERATARVVATIPVADAHALVEQGCLPSSVHAYYYGSWGIRNCDSPFSLGWDGGRLWAIDNARPRLVRVDPDRHAVSGAVALPGPAWDVAIEGQTAWLTGYWDDRITSVDLGTGGVRASAPAGNHGPSALALAGGRVWVVDARGGSLQALDPATLAAEQSIAVEPWSVGIAALGPSLYVRGPGGGVRRFDARDGRESWSAPGAGFLGENGLDRMGATPAGVWLSGPVTARLDAASGTAREALSTASAEVAAAGGEVWVLGLGGRLAKYVEGS